MQTMYEATLNSNFQQPLETVVFTVATPLVGLIIDDLSGKFLCFYALRIMYHLALTVGRYHTVVKYNGFDVLEFTKSPKIVKETISRTYGARTYKSLLYIIVQYLIFGIR